MYMKQTAERAAGTAVLPEITISKKKIANIAKFIGALILLAGTTSWGINFWQHASSVEQTDDAYVTGHVNMLSPRIAGVVQKVLVEDNQFVVEGQPMVVLDPADYQVALENASASLVKAQHGASAAGVSINYSSTKAGAMKGDALGAIESSLSAIQRANAALENARSGVPMAQSTLKQREAELRLAQLNFERMKNLRAQGAISQQDLDTTAKDKEVAEASVKSAREAVSQAESQVLMAQHAVSDAQAQLARSRAAMEEAKAQSVQVDVDKHQADVSRAEIAEAMAKLKNARLQLSYTTIYAPVSGRVGKKTVEIGQHVQSGQPLMAVVPQNFWIVANFKETQLARMKEGQPAHIKVDALPGVELKGKVDSFSPGSGSQFALLPPDNATGNFTKIVQRVPVKIILNENPGSESTLKKIVPGMSAEVEVEVK